MALQSSGEIKISEILTEGGVSSSLANASLLGLEIGAYFTINTANDAADYPDGNAPASISEWYDYDHNASVGSSNDYYWDFSSSGQGLRFAKASGSAISTSVDMCWSLWVRPEWAASDINALLFEFNNSTTATSNRIFLLYDYGLNRFIARLRTNSTNSRGTHWNLQSNSTQTGITSGNWTGSNVGNVNSAGLAHLVLTYDSSATSGSTAFDMYWNGVKMPNKLTNLTGTIFNFDIEQFALNRAVSGTSAARESYYDNFAFFYDKMLSQTEITNLYNSGASLPPDQVAMDDNVILVFDAEADPPVATSGSDYTHTWTNTVDTGSAIFY